MRFDGPRDIRSINAFFCSSGMDEVRGQARKASSIEALRSTPCADSFDSLSCKDSDNEPERLPVTKKSQREKHEFC